jgi:hypothetical protein
LARHAFTIVARRIRVIALRWFFVRVLIPVNYAIILFIEIIQCCIMMFGRLPVF